jgi:hypothetical protein
MASRVSGTRKGKRLRVPTYPLEAFVREVRAETPGSQSLLSFTSVRGRFPPSVALGPDLLGAEP